MLDGSFYTTSFSRPNDTCVNCFWNDQRYRSFFWNDRHAVASIWEGRPGPVLPGGHPLPQPRHCALRVNSNQQMIKCISEKMCAMWGGRGGGGGASYSMIWNVFPHYLPRNLFHSEDFSDTNSKIRKFENLRVFFPSAKPKYPCILLRPLLFWVSVVCL